MSFIMIALFFQYRFDDIREELGEEFIDCGSCPSAMPTSSPSSVPSQAPSVGCNACPTNQAKYVFNSNPLSWTQHNDFATSIGCVMASITSEAEQEAAVTLITPQIPLGATGAYFVWLGGKRSGEDPSIWTWIDGSEDFQGDSDMEVPPYRNWSEGEPSDENADSVGLHLLKTSRFDVGKWDARPSDRLWGALYKCCEDLPGATDFQVCPLAEN